jgi:uncharacterized zinc-type alcohol dehydrogenase-like protein
MNNTRAYAAQSATDAIAPFSFQRREVQPHDVQIDILYCGVCHSDIHQARNEWGGSIYPMVPGHEIVGRVMKTGSKVKNSRPATSSVSDVSSIPAASVRSAKRGMNNIANAG